MRWFKPNLRGSLYGLLGTPAPPSASVLEDATEDIRQAMLDILGDPGVRRFTTVTRRVRYANDVQALWYLRGDLMACLSDMHGEAVARERIARLTRMFQGLLPAGLSSRPSPLIG